MSDVKLSHPSPEQLAAFKEGRLGKAAVAALQAHLETCVACRGRLEATIEFTGSPPDTDSRNLPEAATVIPGVSVPADLAGVPAALAEHPRYRIQELLGTGGMGSVYKAEHRMMERLVALKVINPNLITNPGAVQRFHLEVKAAARLSHPNIVTAYDAEQAGNLHFLVMEFIEGMSLAQVIEKRGWLPIVHACEYIRQTALGLQHAFEQGMVHRDIKPQNLMLTPKGRIKILDFGLARFVSESGPHAELVQGNESGTGKRLTLAGAIMGTPDYIAPEQVTDPRAADIRADIYSLGCTFYNLLTGRPPFPEGSDLQKMMAQIEESPPPVRGLREDVSPELVCVLGRMMAKDPAERYQTPAEVVRALTPFIKSALAAGKETGQPSEHAPVRSDPQLPPLPAATGETPPPRIAEAGEESVVARPRRKRSRSTRRPARPRWLIPGLVIGLVLVLPVLFVGKKVFSTKERTDGLPSTTVSQPPPKPPEGWTELISQEGGFRVLLPSATPVHEKRIVPTPIGPLELHITTVVLPNKQGLYSVIYNELPFVTNPQDKRPIEPAVQNIKAFFQGTRVIGEPKKIRFEGYPGLELNLEQPAKGGPIPVEGTLIMRIYWVKNRQYQIITGGRLTFADNQRFFDSFKLLPR
jgi:serine/threonine protein kinase